MPAITGTKKPTSQATQTELKKGNGKPNGNGKAKKQPPKKEVIYPRIETRVFHHDPKKLPEGVKPQRMSASIMKELLGWQDEQDYEALLKKELPAAEFKQRKIEFGDDYLFLDRYGRKVRLMNNLNNRPFDPRTAEDWMLEILRDKWKFNGESMIIDEYGSCQDIQHRGVGLVWAVQEWEKDNILPEPEQQWAGWKTEPEIDCLVVLGIEGTDEVINTINTGKPRTFADALFRSKVYQDAPREERARLSKITSGAVSFLWKRTDAAADSLAPRRPHSESFDYLENHPRIIECVKFMLAEGDGKKLTPFISLGYAAALLYMMGSASSDFDKYAAAGWKEETLDWKLWDKAQEFWVLFCTNAKVMEPLHEELNKLPVELTTVVFSVALFVKAWNLWSAKKKLTADNLELVINDSNGISELGENPRIGGIDIDREEEPETPAASTSSEPVDENSADEMAKRGICPKLSDVNKKPTPHEYITDEGETFCKHCFDPAPKSGKKGSKKK